ncbi:ABC transporter substrate-binding protein [Amycolatopsis antarctica]|uniref:Endolytic murein transglycosylase n=1 Tax=Amycolatopsis antarctica TaxID=1854586 RepID=A0A263D616_9PSEU|nr:endolytic transglycosylase MltG [Amycolatopsis antarctica]OZM73027.1 ABC transporter substrate-binding protein [Amycolatopsis antarctica]
MPQGPPPGARPNRHHRPPSPAEPGEDGLGILGRRPPAHGREPGPPPDETPTEVLFVEHGRSIGDALDDRGPQAGPQHDDGFHDEGPAGRYQDDRYQDDGYEDDGYYEDDFYEDEFYDEEYDDEEKAEPEYFEDERPEKREGPPRRGKRGKRALGWFAAVAVIVLLAGGAWFGARELLGFGFEDYEGAGESDILVQVTDGDSTNAIAAKLDEADVVASAKAFVEASEDDQKVRSVQPGYYVLKTKMSGTGAVNRLVDPTARVGQMQVRGGTQLDDITQPDGTVTPGVIALLSKASCAELNGQSTCVSPEDLRSAIAEADLAALGAPQWAVEAAGRADPARRIEGLVAPGVYDVKPGSDAKTILGDVLGASALRLQTAGLPDEAGATGQTPYQVLVIASLIEREAVKQDFDKVSRVIYNRIAQDMKLELDSTVNYALDRPVVRTNPEDRERAGPYNTYATGGLPPTPISAPSKEAITAAEKPAQGEWLFFVKCEKNGLSCFAATNEEHNQNRRDAQARGAY